MVQKNWEAVASALFLFSLFCIGYWGNIANSSIQISATEFACELNGTDFTAIGITLIKIKIMKQLLVRSWALIFIFSAGLGVSSCKDKNKETTTTTTDTTTTYQAPVEVTADDALTKGAQDATKDYPGVTASVNNGEVTLTGNIERAKLPDLMQRIQALSPKKVNNQLTLK